MALEWEDIRVRELIVHRLEIESDVDFRMRVSRI